MISTNYFATLGIPLLRGRVFTPRDTEKPPMVAVVDHAFAQRYFPDGNAIGGRIDIGNGTDGFYEIVGVVGNVNHDGLDAIADANDVRAVQAGRLQHDVDAGARRRRPGAARWCGAAGRAGDRPDASGLFDDAARRRCSPNRSPIGASRCCC